MRDGRSLQVKAGRSPANGTRVAQKRGNNWRSSARRYVCLDLGEIRKDARRGAMGNPLFGRPRTPERGAQTPARGLSSALARTQESGEKDALHERMMNRRARFQATEATGSDAEGGANAQLLPQECVLIHRPLHGHSHSFWPRRPCLRAGVRPRPGAYESLDRPQGPNGSGSPARAPGSVPANGRSRSTTKPKTAPGCAVRATSVWQGSVL